MGWPGRLLAHLDEARYTREAWGRVRGFERALGRRLAAADRRRARAYAHEVLGDARHTPDLCAYAVQAGEWRDGWFTQRYLARVVTRRVSAGVHLLALIKSLTVPLFGSDAFPDVLRLIHGRYVDREGRPLTIAQATRYLRDAVADTTAKVAGPDPLGGAPGIDVVLKPDGGFRTIGVRFHAAKDVDLAAWARQVRHGVVQRRIIPHPLLLDVAPSSATTLRITTVRELSGRVTPRAALVKFLPLSPGPDAWRVEAASLRWPIRLAEGCFTATLHGADGSVHRRHPITGAPITPLRVPGLSAAVALTTDLHARLPAIGIVGWDLIVDADERPWPIEWNTRAPTISVVEPLLGPCFTGLGWERLRPPS